MRQSFIDMSFRSCANCVRSKAQGVPVEPSVFDDDFEVVPRAAARPMSSSGLPGHAKAIRERASFDHAKQGSDDGANLGVQRESICNRSDWCGPASLKDVVSFDRSLKLSSWSSDTPRRKCRPRGRELSAIGAGADARRRKIADAALDHAVQRAARSLNDGRFGPRRDLCRGGMAQSSRLHQTIPEVLGRRGRRRRQLQAVNDCGRCSRLIARSNPSTSVVAARRGVAPLSAGCC